MLHKIEDDTGQTWYVGKDDPAHEDVQELRSRHYTWIVLPRAMIQLGHLERYFGFEEDHSCKAALRKARQIGYNSQGGKRHLRLAECLRILGG